MKYAVFVAVFLVAAVFLTGVVSATVPQLINYQGRLTNSVGAPLDTTATLIFSIYADSLGVTNLWSETHTDMVIKEGLFQVLMGSTSTLGENVFDGSKRWLGVQLQGGPAPTALIPIISVPYAYRAGRADTASFAQSSAGASKWTLIGSTLYTNNYWGISRGGAGNILHGDSAHTMTNFGTRSFTGTISQNYGYSTIAGGSDNAARNWYSTVGGGNQNAANSNYSSISGGGANTVGGEYGAILGGNHNRVDGQYSAIPGGYCDTVNSGYSYLFGIKSKLTRDSTFMVDMPHIRFGKEIGGYEFPPTDGISGQVLSTNGAGKLSWSGTSTASGWTNGGSIVRLSNVNDSVGIGTSTPAAKIHVIGPSAEGQIGGALFGVSGTHTSTLNYGASATNLYGPYGRHNASGNYGVLGSSTAGVYGNSSTGFAGFFEGKAYIGSGLGIGTSMGLSMLDVEGGAAIGVDYSSIYAAPTNGLIVEGKTGIGVYNPSAKLQVHASGDWNAPHITLSTPTYGETRIVQGNSGQGSSELGLRNYGATGYDRAFCFRDSTNSRLLSIYADGDVEVLGRTCTGSAMIGSYYCGVGGVSPSNGLAVEGNVAIGTTSAANKLHVVGDAFLEMDGGRLYLKTPTRNYGDKFGIAFQNMDNAPFLGDDSQDQYFSFYTGWSSSRSYNAHLRVYGHAAGSWGKFVEINHDGSSANILADAGHINLQPFLNVGIGTTTPGYKLDVAGSCHASSFPTSSDERLKKNIRPLVNVLEKIDHVRGVSFDWNETYDSLGRSTGRREIGVIAQDVEAQFPELVTKWGDQNYRAVDYGRLSAVLIEAVKELKKENESLKQRLDALEKR